MPKLKIIHLISNLDTGGAELMLCRLVKNMNKSQFDSVVISMTTQGTLGESLALNGIKVYSLNFARGKISLNGIFQLWKILRCEKPMIIQTWLYHADLLGLFVGRLCGINKVLWNIRCSNMDLSHYNKLTFRVVAILARLSRIPTIVIANSYAGMKWHQALGYNPRRWEVIPNGFDTEFYRPCLDCRASIRHDLKIPHEAFCFGLIARYDPMKDPHNFLHAARICLDAIGDEDNSRSVLFVLVGRQNDYDNAQLVGWIDKYNLRSNVRLLGERNDIQNVLNGLDMVVSSSISEGFPNSIGEAMCCCIPCIVTDVGDSAKLVGDTGQVVPSADSASLGIAMKEWLLMDAARRLQFGEKARCRIMEHYSMQSITRKYESLYCEVVANVRVCGLF